MDARTSKTDSAGTATFRRDGVDSTDSVISDGNATYTPGISERRGSTTKFYAANYQGTNNNEENTSQTITATKTYDAWGVRYGSSGSSASPFGFAGSWGYQEDADSSLKLLGHRYYDPSIGQFLTRDPDGNGRNWYAYANSNPLSLVDPDGLDPSKGGKQNQRNSEYDDWDDDDISERLDQLKGRKSAGEKQEQQSLQKEQKARKLRNKGKREENNFGFDPIWEPVASQHPAHSIPITGPWYNPSPSRIPFHPSQPGRGSSGSGSNSGSGIDWGPGAKAAGGLTAGAILYWTVSELSRLFPPRNLLPIP